MIFLLRSSSAADVGGAVLAFLLSPSSSLLEDIEEDEDDEEPDPDPEPEPELELESLFSSCFFSSSNGLELVSFILTSSSCFNCSSCFLADCCRACYD